MYMVSAMPKAILIHSVQYKEYKGEGRYGKEYKEPITLKNVLIQPVSSINKSNDINTVAYNSLMFYDCTNSQPRNINFTKDSIIVFNDEEMRINKVNPIYTFKLHHYELELI